MAPAAARRGTRPAGVGEHRQHERLGVPERVAVVAGPGQALGGDRARLGARAAACSSWKRAKRRPCWISGSPSSWTSAPPSSRRGSARWAAASPSKPSASAISRLASTWSRSHSIDCWRGPVVGEELDQRSGWPGSRCAAIVTRPRSSLALGQRVAWSPEPSTTWSMPAASASRVRRVECASTDALAVVDGELRLERRRRAPRPSAGRSARQLRLVGDQVRLQRDAHRPVDASTSYAIAATLRCSKETSRRCARARCARPRGPGHCAARARPSGSRARARGARGAAVDVERLVLDEQPDDLPVGDVDDGLAVLGEAVAALAVLERIGLVEAVEVGAAERRAARPRRGCRAGRGARWPARRSTRPGDQASRSSAVSRTAHGSTGKRVLRDHAGSSSSARSSTTTSAPCSRERVGLADPVDADDVAEVAGAARLDAGQGVLEHRRLRGLDAELLGGRQERVRRRLALAGARARRRAPSTRGLEAVGDAGGRRGPRGCSRSRRRRRSQAGVARRSR